MIEWQHLKTSKELQSLIQKSHDTPAAIFKHSTRCGASAIVKERLEEDWDFENGEIDIYLLDLIAHRDLSNEVSKTFGVRHESPQILVINDGQSIFDTSHGDVSVTTMRKALQKQY
jgi:bacillithiol system protein YtxJ